MTGSEGHRCHSQLLDVMGLWEHFLQDNVWFGPFLLNDEGLMNLTDTVMTGRRITESWKSGKTIGHRTEVHSTFICLSILLYANVWLSHIYLSIYLYIYLSIYQSVCVCLSIYLSHCLHLSNYLTICLSHPDVVTLQNIHFKSCLLSIFDHGAYARNDSSLLFDSSTCFNFRYSICYNM